MASGRANTPRRGAGLSAPAAAAKQEQLAQHRETLYQVAGAGALDPASQRARRRLDWVAPQAHRGRDEGRRRSEGDGEVRKLYAEARRGERENRALASLARARVGCEDAHRASRPGGRGHDPRLLRGLPGGPADGRTRGAVVHRTAVPGLADRWLGRRPAGSLGWSRARRRARSRAGTGWSCPTWRTSTRPNWTLVVHPAQRRHGLGRALLRHAAAPGGGARAFGAQRRRTPRRRRRGLRAFGGGGARAGGRAARHGRARDGRRAARPAARDRRAGGGGLLAGVVDRTRARGVPRAGGGAVRRAQRRPARSAHRAGGLGRAAGPRAGQRPAPALRAADLRGGGAARRYRGAGGANRGRGGSGRSGLGAPDAHRRDPQAPRAPARPAGEDRDGGVAAGGGAGAGTHPDLERGIQPVHDRGQRGARLHHPRPAGQLVAAGRGGGAGRAGAGGPGRRGRASRGRRTARWWRSRRWSGRTSCPGRGRWPRQPAARPRSAGRRPCRSGSRPPGTTPGPGW